jgi:VanZ family protein
MKKDPANRAGSTTRVAVAALAMVALFTVLNVPLPTVVYQSRLLGAIENAAHGPLFAAVGCLAAWLLGSTSWRNYLAAWLIVAGVSVCTEIAQHLGSRNPSWGDVRTDLLGATAGLALWAV